MGHLNMIPSINIDASWLIVHKQRFPDSHDISITFILEYEYCRDLDSYLMRPISLIKLLFNSMIPFLDEAECFKISMKYSLLIQCDYQCYAISIEDKFV